MDVWSKFEWTLSFLYCFGWQHSSKGPVPCSTGAETGQYGVEH